jgi:hypothetical protein
LKTHFPDGIAEEALAAAWQVREKHYWPPMNADKNKNAYPRSSAFIGGHMVLLPSSGNSTMRRNRQSTHLKVGALKREMDIEYF